MVLQYFGLGMVKASVGEEVICFAPMGKSAARKAPQFGADVALIPLRDENYNGISQVTHAPREPFVIDGPGEYEVRGTFIRGVATAGNEGKLNTCYSVVFDDIKLVHLGAISEAALSPEAKEVLSDADILFVPTYNEDTLDATAAYKLASGLNPKVIVPLYIGSKGETLDKFFKEAGEERVKPVDKFTFKRKDVEAKEGEIIPICTF